MSNPERTLAAIFAEPTRANISWREIESLFRHYGAQISQGAGSRVRVAFGEGARVIRATFHRPHPQHEAHKPLVRSARRFLTEAGITP